MARHGWMFLVLVACLALAPALAEARAGKGGSFGSRGTRTYQAPPATQTAPAPKPVERSVTQPAAPGQQAAPAAAAARPAGPMASPFATGLLGGLIGAGLMGLLLGHGLNLGALDLAGTFGLMLQMALIAGAVWMVMAVLRRRQAAPAMARTATAPAAGPMADAHPLDLSGAARARAPQAAEDGVNLAKGDFDAFEQTLKDVQDAFSRADVAALGRLSTPEMVSYFNEQLTDDASAGLTNRIEGVSLEQGDLAEAWREGGHDYATVAMRWRARDYTVEAESGRVVSGDAERPIEATELWTFVRGASGRWLVSAIQQG